MLKTSLEPLGGQLSSWDDRPPGLKARKIPILANHGTQRLVYQRLVYQRLVYQPWVYQSFSYSL